MLWIHFHTFSVSGSLFLLVFTPKINKIHTLAANSRVKNLERSCSYLSGKGDDTGWLNIMLSCGES